MTRILSPMIGVFDSGHGGITVLEALVRRFPGRAFSYLGDHANAPYGDRSAADVIDLTRAGVERLFERGCRLVLLGCNTATAVAARALQQHWLPPSGWEGHNLLGIVAPTVEAATQTPWGVTTPQYPQKYLDDVIVVFGTVRTVSSGVYPDEIRKRCPQVEVVQQAIPGLAGAIETGAPIEEISAMVESAVEELARIAEDTTPDRVILGCTHFPMVGEIFAEHLPQTTRLLSQPTAVADSLEDYLARHPEFDTVGDGPPMMLTTGKPAAVDAIARRFWPGVPGFTRV